MTVSSRGPEAWGSPTAPLRRRSDPKTLYRIASITKTFTATAIMQLRDDGKLALDDPAVSFLPELEAAQSPLGPIESLTIRRMLSHESGLQSEPPGTDWSDAVYEDDPGRTLARAAEIATRVPVHTQWKYSNLAYQLLGEIVSRVSGTPYPTYIRTKLLRPLGMTATSLDPLPARLRARRATGYEPRFLSDELDLAPQEVNVFGAEGGLWSCVEDLARWLSCQLADDPGVIARKTLDEMHKPRYLVDEAWTQAWCIGWYARRRDDVVWTMHSGGYYGFITNACFEPKEKIGAIALVNGIGNATELALQLGTIAREAVREAAPAIEVPEPLPEAWRPFVGLYTAPHFGTVLRVEWLDGKLTVLDPDAPDWKPTLDGHRRSRCVQDRAGFPRVGRARAIRAREGRAGGLALLRGCEAPAPGARRAGLATLDQLDAVVVRITHETDARAALRDLIRRPLGLDAMRVLQSCERSVEVVDGDRDVPVPGAEVVRATIVVERQLEDVLGVSEREEVVRRLALAVSDDVHVAGEAKAERLVEAAAPLGVRDPNHRVEEGGHRPILVIEPVLLDVVPGRARAPAAARGSAGRARPGSVRDPAEWAGSEARWARMD